MKAFSLYFVLQDAKLLRQLHDANALTYREGWADNITNTVFNLTTKAEDEDAASEQSEQVLKKIDEEFDKEKETLRKSRKYLSLKVNHILLINLLQSWAMT